MSGLPAPLTIDPAQNWDGIDGDWNSFNVQIGTPPQTVRVFPSTASQQTWAIAPDGCYGASNVLLCQQIRGMTFNSSASSTWDFVGTYSLYIEQNLGYQGNGSFGFDTVVLGGNGDNGPSIHNATVGVTPTLSFFLGIFGLHPKPTNFTGFNDPSPSYMTLLKQQKLIPSLSFGYTAGAQYRFSGRLGSLTLGGYDRDLFEENDIEFTMASNNERDIVVGLQGTYLGTNTSNAMNEGVYMFIDSTVSQIWLPPAVCDEFESAFGLTYNNTTGLYFVDDTQYANLLSLSPNVTFALGVGTAGGDTINITLPYASFDKYATAPYMQLQGQRRYFPIRRAATPNIYTFGRTFLQEAYLSVDWERAKFNVSQNVWQSSTTPDVVPVTPFWTSDSASGGSSGGSSGLSGGAIAGIVVGAVAGLALIAAVVWAGRRRCKRRQRQQQQAAQEKTGADRRSGSSSNGTLQAPGVVPKAELDAGSDANSPSAYAKYEPSAADSYTLRPASSTAPASASPLGTLLVAASPQSPRSPQSPVVRAVGGLQEVENREREVYEMPGDVPAPAEMPEQGHAGPTAKERDILREREFNGVNPAEQT